MTTDTAPWPPGLTPSDRVRHSWRCTRRAPVVETVKPDSTGRKRIVSHCIECGHDDMPDWIRAEAGATELDQDRGRRAGRHGQ